MSGIGIDNLNLMHVDILREIGNIGAGSAATTLAKMLGKKVDMTVPIVNVPEFKNVANSIGGAENLIIGILVKIQGDINGIMMYLLEEASACFLVNSLIGRSIGSISDFTELEFSAVKEVGNILSSAYLNALSSLTNLNLKPSVPYMAVDMAGAILSVPAIEFGKVGDKVLFIESNFVEDKQSVSGYFILIPDMNSFEVILKSLGVM